MDKKALLAAAAIAFAALACATPARSQVHAQLGPASVLERDVRLGVFGLAGDDQLGAIADSRFLLTDGLDMGFQVGFRQLTGALDETVLDGGMDLRRRVFEPSESPGFDLSAGGGFGFTLGDDLTVLTGVAQCSVSRAFYTRRDREVAPYAGFVLSVSSTKRKGSEADGKFADPDLDVSLRVGLAAQLSGSATLTGELQVREDPAAYIGLSTSF